MGVIPLFVLCSFYGAVALLDDLLEPGIKPLHSECTDVPPGYQAPVVQIISAQGGTLDRDGDLMWLVRLQGNFFTVTYADPRVKI